MLRGPERNGRAYTSLGTPPSAQKHCGGHPPSFEEQLVTADALAREPPSPGDSDRKGCMRTKEGMPATHPLVGIPPQFVDRSSSVPAAAFVFLPSPPPAEWEKRLCECISALKRRPLLCPEELVRRTGALPPLGPEDAARGVMGWREAVAVRGGTRTGIV